MKFRFKIQQYQTDAVNSVVRVFQGQPKVEGLSYRRDIGTVPEALPLAEEQISFFASEQKSLFDPEDDTGFLNERIRLSDNEL